MIGMLHIDGWTTARWLAAAACLGLAWAEYQPARKPPSRQQQRQIEQAPTGTMPGVYRRTFDFTDAHYLANGINPAGLVGRIEPDGITGASDAPSQRRHRAVRPLVVQAAYTHSGNPVFFSTVASVRDLNSFTADAAGVLARGISETYCLYCFPKRVNQPGVLNPRRQEPVADMRNGYDTGNPLGLWRCNIVTYTSAAFNTPGGQQALASLAARNGLDADGTPIIKKVNEIEDLLDDGYISVERPPEDGSKGPRWYVCPMIDDPTGFAIAGDARLDVVRNADGTVFAGSAGFERQFSCLQRAGGWCLP